MALNRQQGPWPRPVPPVQYTTSRCMTCWTTVRYPKTVDNFRCSVCATVNTLETLEKQTLQREAQREERLKSTKKGMANEDAQLPKIKPLNAAYMQHVLDDCILAYLVAMFCKDGTVGTTAGDEAPRLPDNGELPAYTMKAGPSETIYDAKHEAKYNFSSEPTLRKDLHHLNIAASKASPSSNTPVPGPSHKPSERARRKMYFEEDCRRIFDPARDYIANCFSSVHNLNQSFLIGKENMSTTASKRTSTGPALQKSSEDRDIPMDTVCGVDSKLLLLGGVAKNGSWWVGGHDKFRAPPATSRKDSAQTPSPPEKTPSINFSEVEKWYQTIVRADANWDRIWQEVRLRPNCGQPTAAELAQARKNTRESAKYTIDRLMKHTETLLMRVGGQITQPEELRFLLIILENPLLGPEPEEDILEGAGTWASPLDEGKSIGTQPSSSNRGSVAGRHSRILKRVVGLMANCPSKLHPHLISWFSNYEKPRFVRIKDLISGFLTYRLVRQDKSANSPEDFMNNLIPDLHRGSNIGSLHEALRQGNAARRKIGSYCSDWQVSSATQVLGLLFEANHPHSSRLALSPSWRTSLVKGAFLPTSDFYVSMIDYIDVVADYLEFEKLGGKFAFCRFPFLMSVWAKTQVLNFVSKRQMRQTARDAFINDLMRHTQTRGDLTLEVRRDCLADDSLKAIGQSMGRVGNESKKELKIKFKGEEGIDGGGLRKEWFLLLVREIFNPDLGLFEYDEDSQYCYFNPHTLDEGNQFYLVGIILGLAIYNSTILDVPLPPFVFQRLAFVRPQQGYSAGPSEVPLHKKYTLGDLAQFRPSLARGLKQLLDFNGDIGQTFMRTFVVSVDMYGARYEVPLCRNGENIPVTNKNRREYVDLYIQYLLDTSVSRQFEPFTRGFRQVCTGSAFGLFRPEEIELLIRGSDEPLDVHTLRAVAEYDEWLDPSPDGSVAQVVWFWDIFLEASPADQRKLLLFITGSDRMPAAGASMMPLTLSCLGGDCDRLPTARTCFNRLSLWRYATKGKMRRLLWLAVHESEGFGLA